MLLQHNLLTEEMCWRGKTVSLLSSSSSSEEVSGKLETEKPLDKFQLLLCWLHRISSSGFIVFKTDNRGRHKWQNRNPLLLPQTAT